MNECLKLHSSNIHPTLFNSCPLLHWRIMLVLLGITHLFKNSEKPDRNTTNKTIKNHKILIISALIIVNSFISYPFGMNYSFLTAQTPKIDTIKFQLAEHPTQDSLHINLLNELSMAYWNIAPKKNRFIGPNCYKTFPKIELQIW